MLRSPSPIALDTYFLVVENTPGSSNRFVLHGINWETDYGTAVHLLVFSGVAVPAADTAPIAAALDIPTTGAGTRRFDPPIEIAAPGIVIAASSTPDKMTVVSAATMQITALVEETDPAASRLIGGTTVGDLTTAVDSLQIWADSAGPKRLMRVKVKNNVASVRYLTVYAEDTPDANSEIVTHVELAASQDREFSFGTGLVPFQHDAGGTNFDGCTLHCAEDLVAGSKAAATDFNIEAVHQPA